VSIVESGFCAARSRGTAIEPGSHPLVFIGMNLGLCRHCGRIEVHRTASWCPRCRGNDPYPSWNKVYKKPCRHCGRAEVEEHRAACPKCGGERPYPLSTGFVVVMMILITSVIMALAASLLFCAGLIR